MRRLLLPVLGAALLALAACGGGSTGSVTATSASSVPTTGDGSAADVPAALRITADRLGGGTIDAASYAGRPVAFWFWAPT